MVLDINEFVETECCEREYELEDYEGDTPRWCKGCGDHGILAAVQKTLRDRKIPPEKVVCVSGIGCSSRFPHYLKTYGFHGIHGRALPLSTGISIMRPDLHVITIMGDGDCFSIGAGHWLHALRYNVNLTVLVFDNEIYGLTKKQVSPTTKEGALTNTTPRGAYLRNLNPLTLMLGVTNVSFLAQTATWLGSHMEATIEKAWDHKGLSFVRLLQRCPVYTPTSFANAGPEFPAVFLESEDGIPAHKGFLKNAPTLQHDHTNIIEAQTVAYNEDEAAPMGLLFQDKNVVEYGELRRGRTTPVSRTELITRLNTELDKYAVI